MWRHVKIAAGCVEGNKVYVRNEWACNVNSPLHSLCHDLYWKNIKFFSQVLVRKISFPFKNNRWWKNPGKCKQNGGRREEDVGQGVLFFSLSKANWKPQKLMPVTPSAQRSQGTLQTSADLPVTDGSITSQGLAQD